MPANRAAYRRKWWALLLLPLGLTTWAAFLWLGIAYRRRSLFAWAGAYFAGLVAWGLLDAPANVSGTRAGVGALFWVLTWIGGGIHGLALLPTLRRTGPPLPPPDVANDPQVLAGFALMERRRQGRELLRSQPAVARTAGVGRPDVAGSDDCGLVDLNHVPEATLGGLPGLTHDLVQRIVDARARWGGFSSVDELALADVPPDVIDGLRQVAVFVPD